MIRTESDVILTAASLDDYTRHLVSAPKSAWASHGDRMVKVSCLYEGRYTMYYNGEYLNDTHDVFRALWFLKTGEWVGRDGKLYVDTVKKEEKE